MKLKLNLEQLTVDSFDTTATQKERGTVFGEQCTCYTQCTCPGCPSCDATCPNTCAYTCDDNTCLASCNGTCGGSCDGAWTCDYCTINDATCNGYGTCGRYPCKQVP
jgi:hypothetical protein